MTKFKLLAAFIVGIAFSFPVAAKMFKWVDDNGTTHYGETIPPEYANKDRSQLEKGRVIKKDEVLTPEERRAKEAADDKKRVDDGLALDQKRRDKALVNTYSSEKEIDLARNRNLQQVDTRVSGISSQLKMVNDSLLALQKEAEGLNKEGKKVPPSLQEDILETKARINKLQQDLEKSNAEKAAMNARYDADKARYKELTGK